MRDIERGAWRMAVAALALLGGLAHTTPSHGGTPLDDAKSTLASIDAVQKIKTELKDAAQVADALKALDAAANDLPKFRDLVDKGVASDAGSNIKGAESSLVDRTKKCEEKVKKALEKLKSAKGDASKTKDAQGYVKDAIAAEKELGTYLFDLGQQIKESAKAGGDAAKATAELAAKSDAACDAADALGAKHVASVKAFAKAAEALRLALAKPTPSAAEAEKLEQELEQRKKDVDTERAAWAAKRKACMAAMKAAAESDAKSTGK